MTKKKFEQEIEKYLGNRFGIKIKTASKRQVYDDSKFSTTGREC